jgi:hypothetical protein
MRALIYSILIIFASINIGNANIYTCIESAKKYEKIYQLPENLLVSVALTESGKKLKSGEFVAWPWTVNIKGQGKFFKSKDSVLKYVKSHIKKGKKNIDMGCMQVNYMYHPNAFTNLSLAFDPETNVKWSANLIKNLYDKYGSYKDAVGYYHSYRTIKKNKYSSKVFNTWRELNKNNIYAHININQKLTTTSFNPKVKIKKIKTVNLGEKHGVPALEQIIKTIETNTTETTKVNSSFILARMEKVRFFRNYFLNY